MPDEFKLNYDAENKMKSNKNFNAMFIIQFN